jgi:benzoylformate decarboxylase
VEDIPQATRRAIQTALTPPTGPVFLALPVDVQMEESTDLDVSAASVPDRRTRPSFESLRRAAGLLHGARSPAILAGSRVTESNAIPELVELAESLGAPVFSEATTSHGRLPFPADHPQYRGILSYWAPEIHKTLSQFDIVLAVGLSLFRVYIHRPPDRLAPASTRIVHLDNVPWDIGKNFPVEIPLIGDPKCGMAELVNLLRANGASSDAARVAERRAALADLRRTEQGKLLTTIESQRALRPMSPLVFMEALARALPANVAVIEEAVTTHQNVFERLGALKDPSGFFAHRGWALGWGMGCALGVKLAWPDRPVLALIGDGSALYGLQALWSAAHHRIPVTFIIANNRQYQILKACGDVMGLPQLRAASCPGMNLDQPEVDFVALARAFGVEALQIETPGDLTDAVRDSLAGNASRLLDVLIAR